MSDDIKDGQYQWQEKPLLWQKQGLSYTASGFGAKIPSRWMINYEGRWRRVYVMIYSNAGSAYIMVGKRKLFIPDYLHPK